MPNQGIETAFNKIEARSIETENGCFEWQGPTIGQGYGHIRCDGAEWYIHRLAFRRFICEQLPEVVMHSCDNTRCWNPDHLVGGTHADNVNDKVRKGRHNYGTKNYNARLTEGLVQEIRASGLSLMELVAKYGISKGAIHCVLTGATWKHVK